MNVLKKLLCINVNEIDSKLEKVDKVITNAHSNHDTLEE